MSKMIFLIFISVLIQLPAGGAAEETFDKRAGEFPKAALRKIMQKCVDICIDLDPVYNDNCQAGCYQKVFSNDYFWA